MKVPERPPAPRLYTIPPSAPFLTTLARALLSGDLPLPGGAKPDPLTLPLTTIYLPTRRAARALREAFLAESGGQALLLPRIHALGHADEEAAIIFGAEEADGADGALGAPAIDALPRRLALMQLILAWGQASARDATEAEIEAIKLGQQPGPGIEPRRRSGPADGLRGVARRSTSPRSTPWCPRISRPIGRRRSSFSRSSPSTGRNISPTTVSCRRSPGAIC